MVMAENVFVFLQVCVLVVISTAIARVSIWHNGNFSTGLVLACRDGVFTLDSGVTFQRNGVDIQVNGGGTLSYPLTQETEGNFTCAFDGQTSQILTFAAVPFLDFTRHRSHCVPIPVNETVSTELSCDIRPGAARENCGVVWRRFNPSGGFSQIIEGINQETFSLTLSVDANSNDTVYTCEVCIDHDGVDTTILYNGAEITIKTTGPCVPPQITNAVISVADVGETECVVTVRWSDPVISCNGSTSQYVLTLSPPTTECPSGDCVVGKGDEGFEEREQSVTLAVDQMYIFNLRADSCSNTQTGVEGGQYTVEMEAHSDLCQYSYEYDVSKSAIQAIQTTWRRVFLRPLGEAEYTLIINPGGLRQPVTSPDCNSTHCSYTFSADVNEHGYSVSVEAMGCVTGVTVCQDISRYCDPNELIPGVERVEMGYAFLEGQVTYNGISENATSTYTTNKGFSFSDRESSIKICQNGSWTGKGTPIFVKDSDTGDVHQLSYGAAVATTGVLCSVVSFTVGVLLGALLLHLITRARGKPPTSPHPPEPYYDDVVSTASRRVRGHREENIDLKSNEVYGVLDKKTINSNNQL